VITFHLYENMTTPQHGGGVTRRTTMLSPLTPEIVPFRFLLPLQSNCSLAVLRGLVSIDRPRSATSVCLLRLALLITLTCLLVTAEIP
jgi:hypothetical protein